MFDRITRSLAYRLPLCYRFLLQHRPIKSILKPQSPICMVSMTGKAHLPLLRLCLLSAVATWSQVPTLTIVNDGSLSNQDIAKTLHFWPGSFKIESLEETYQFHQLQNRNALLRYANENPFGKKLAVILKHASQKPVLWVDSDILFFNDLLCCLPKIEGRYFCAGSEDALPAFDERILKILNYQPEPQLQFNAGLLYVFGKDIYEDFGLEAVLNHIHPAYDFLTEQTIFAYLASKSMGILWPRTAIENSYADHQQLKPNRPVNLLGRHYTSNVRHLFWRDAYFLVNFKGR